VPTPGLPPSDPQRAVSSGRPIPWCLDLAAARRGFRTIQAGAKDLVPARRQVQHAVD